MEGQEIKIYLASPNNQLQAEHCIDQATLLSFACVRPWIESYIPAFGSLLIDSGAYSQMTTGKAIDVQAYKDWVEPLLPMIDNWAGLDDINGDWRQSMRNYEAGGFPTIHDTDPPELLDDLIPLAEERGNWIGIGLKPPRQGKEKFLRGVLDRIPPHLHVHGWALVAYRYLNRIDSFDSTFWWHQVQDLRPKFPWLTPGECLELAIKQVRRYSRVPGRYNVPSHTQMDLLGE